MSVLEGSKNVVVHGGTFIAQRVEPTKGNRAFDLLAAKALPSAYHMADADAFHSTCYPNTRVRIQAQIRNWAKPTTTTSDSVDTPIIWLHGAAGGGKTAIGRTIAQWCQEQGILLGEFFFSRVDGHRASMESLTATLAYRMATETLPASRDAIIGVVAQNPHIFSASLATQMKSLVLEPLNDEGSRTDIPYVVIFDGLDECLSAYDQDLLLREIGQTLLPLNPRLRCLIGSRPEPAIRTAFNAPLLKEITMPISLNDDPDSDEAIRMFVTEQFAQVKQQLSHILDTEWPTDDDISHIVRKSSGHFIFAATVVRYVCSPTHRHNAVARLKHVLGQNHLPLHITQRGHPFAELDALYSIVLSTREVEDPEITVKATAICIEYPKYFDAITPPDLARVLQIEVLTIRSMLDELASLFGVDDDDHIELYHPSFADFLYDKSRSGNISCEREDVLTGMTCALLHPVRNLDVLPSGVLVRLLEDIAPNQTLQSALEQLGFSSLFSERPYDDCDAVPLLRQLLKHSSASRTAEVINWFDSTFAKYIADTYEDWFRHSQTNDSNKSLNRYDQGSTDSPPSAADETLTQGNSADDQAAEGDLSGYNGVHPMSTAQLQYEDSRAIIMAALLSVLPSWDSVLTTEPVDPTRSKFEAFKSICREAPFIVNHLPLTLSILLDDTRQSEAAVFCLERLASNGYSDPPNNMFSVFARVLPDTLSRASSSPKLTGAVGNLLLQGTRYLVGGILSLCPQEAQEAILNYIQVHDIAFPRQTHYSTSTLRNTPRPSAWRRRPYFRSRFTDMPGLLHSFHQDVQSKAEYNPETRGRALSKHGRLVQEIFEAIQEAKNAREIEAILGIGEDFVDTGRSSKFQHSKKNQPSTSGQLKGYDTPRNETDHITMERLDDKVSMLVKRIDEIQTVLKDGIRGLRSHLATITPAETNALPKTSINGAEASSDVGDSFKSVDENAVTPKNQVDSDSESGNTKLRRINTLKPFTRTHGKTFPTRRDAVILCIVLLLSLALYMISDVKDRIASQFLYTDALSGRLESLETGIGAAMQYTAPNSAEETILVERGGRDDTVLSSVLLPLLFPWIQCLFRPCR